MDISFIIVNWNTKKLTQQAIQSILETCPSNLTFEVIVVDNNSSDGSPDYLRQSFDGNTNIIIHCMSENVGYGPAHNEGYSISQGEWIFFLNSDVVFLIDCIRNLHSAASIDKMAGLYSPRVLNEDLSNQDVFSFLMPYTYALFFRMLFRRRLEHEKAKRNIISFEMIHGVAYFVHRKFIEKYGFWSNDFIMYAEDWDFCFRIYKNKKKCLMVSDAKLIHLSQSSSKKKWSSLEKNKMMEIARNRFAKKYGQFGCYELYWIYNLLKSIFKGYMKGIEWHKDMAKAKIWFLKIRFWGNIKKAEKTLLE